MKKLPALLLLLLTIFISGELFSQQKPKPKPTDKPPTQKELDEMMKEMKNMMGDMSEEDKKALDDMMKNGSFQKAIANAGNSDDGNIPAKDVSRIAFVTGQPALTSGSVLPYVQSINKMISTQLGSTKTATCEEIFKWVSSNYTDPSQLGTAAAGLFMLGKVEPSLYLMGKAVQAAPNDPDLLNNYASMMSMNGGEHLAIPMLDYLNKQYPDNSTLLNNLGQAWFGLGDLLKAEPFIKNAIKFYPGHRQANLTKSYIEASKGNTAAAIEAARIAIKEAYSPEKDSWLRKLGYDLKDTDLGWDPPMPQDPLGLEEFGWPEYPATINEAKILEPLWDHFREECRQRLNELDEEEDRLTAIMEEEQAKREQKVEAAASTFTPINPFPGYALKAAMKLKHLVTDEKILRDQQSFNEKQMRAISTEDELDSTYSLRYEKLQKEFSPRFGEGKENPFEQACGAYTTLTNEHLSAINTNYSTYYLQYFEFYKKRLSDELYFDQYTKWPDEFEVAKVRAKKQWLGLIMSQKVKFLKFAPYCTDEPVEKLNRKDSLKKFEDMNCEYKSEINLIIGKITSNCSELSAELEISLPKNGSNIDLAKLKWTTRQQDNSNENSFLQQMQAFSAEVGVKSGVGITKGPLKGELKAGVSGYVEWSRSGPSDVGVKVSGDVKVGTDIVKQVDIDPATGKSVKDPITGGPVKDPSLTIVGAEAKLSFITGAASVGGKGILTGLSRKLN